MTSDEIFLISGDQLTAMNQRSMREGLFGETLEVAFQRLLEEHPDVIPGRQIRPGTENPPRFLLIRREAPVGSWSLDHLFVDQHAVPTLVECKLLENPESRRDVIGQIIEYAANAKLTWSDGRLRTLAHDYWASRGKSFEEVFYETFELDEDTDDFWVRVEENLDAGNIRLIIAGDEIRPEVRRMIEYLNQEMEHVEVLGLELRCYGPENQLVLVPNIVGQLQSSADKRVASGDNKRWHPPDVRDAYAKSDDREWASLALGLLDWTEASDRFIPSTAKRATFGISGSQDARIMSIYEADGAWAMLNAKKLRRSG